MIRASHHRQVGRNVRLGHNSKIVGKRVIIGNNVRIGRDVSIQADEVTIGSRCEIEDRVQVFWRRGVPRLFTIGDCSMVGSDCKIYVKELVCGDYVALHNHVMINGDSSCRIGHNTYIGQNCILNANAPVRIGSGVGIVAYSAVWTHGKFGELIEGSTVHREAPVVIEDDVTMWRAIVSPGVTIGRRATILNGSVIIRDVDPYSVVGGTPAQDLGQRMRSYGRVTDEEKFQMMRDFVSEFLETNYPGEYLIAGEEDYRVGYGRRNWFRLIIRREITSRDVRGRTPLIAVTMKDSSPHRKPGVTVFDVPRKTYTKQLTEPEVKFMRFLLDARARFLPREAPKASSEPATERMLIGKAG